MLSTSFSTHPSSTDKPHSNFGSVSDFSKSLTAQQPGDQSTSQIAAGGIEVRTAPPDPANYDLPIDNLFQIEAAENVRPGFADSNYTVPQTVFMSYGRGREYLFAELNDIFKDINSNLQLALYMPNYHPDGIHFNQRVEHFERRIGNLDNIVLLPSLGYDPTSISDPISTFPEDGKYYGYDEHGNPVVFGFGEARQAEVRQSLEELEGASLIHPQRSYEIATMTAQMFDGLGFRELEYLTYGGDFHVGRFTSASDSEQTVQKQFFGRESVLLARERIFAHRDSLPEHLSGLNEEQEFLFAASKIMEEIESVAGTASQAFPLGAGEVTIGEILETLPPSIIEEMSPSVLQRLRTLGEFELPLEYADNKRLNYHVDTFMAPLTDNIVLVDQSAEGASFVDMLRSDPDIDLHFLPSRSEYNNLEEETRTSYMNMLTINDGEKLHLILPTENSDKENLSLLDIQVKTMLENLGFTVHFTSYQAVYDANFVDYGLNCLTEISSFAITDETR